MLTTTLEVDPSAFALAAVSVPVFTVVAPVFELLPLRTKVPVPFLVTPPVPLRLPETVSVSPLSTSHVALFTVIAPLKVALWLARTL